MGDSEPRSLRRASRETTLPRQMTARRKPAASGVRHPGRSVPQFAIYPARGQCLESEPALAPVAVTINIPTTAPRRAHERDLFVSNPRVQKGRLLNAASPAHTHKKAGRNLMVAEKISAAPSTSRLVMESRPPETNDVSSIWAKSCPTTIRALCHKQHGDDYQRGGLPSTMTG